MDEVLEHLERAERALERIRLALGAERPRARPSGIGGRRMIHDIVTILQRHGQPIPAGTLLHELNHGAWWDTTLDVLARSLRNPHNKKLVYDAGGERLEVSDLVGLRKWKKG